jgi:hypothetical protein
MKDSHGLLLTRHERYLGVADRAANLVVIDTATYTVVNEIPLAGAVSADPAPDLLDLSPMGNRVYVTLRGPRPLTGNKPEVNNAKGRTPGLGVIGVRHRGRSGVLQAIFPISNVDGNGMEHADPHGVAVRRNGQPLEVRRLRAERLQASIGRGRGGHDVGGIHAALSSHDLCP